MSASLVGSEMCIRDSFIGEAPIVVFTDPADLSSFGPEDHRISMGRFRACLLYTSDAADDM
eukprot:2437935-Alexandrium_andersonii.AAC.1